MIYFITFVVALYTFQIIKDRKEYKRYSNR